MGRRPAGRYPMSDAERQANHRARIRKAQHRQALEDRLDKLSVWELGDAPPVVMQGNTKLQLDFALRLGDARVEVDESEWLQLAREAAKEGHHRMFTGLLDKAIAHLELVREVWLEVEPEEEEVGMNWATAHQS